MTTNAEIEFTVADLAGPARLDQLLRRAYPTWGRQTVQRLIGARAVQVNRKTVWLASWLVHNGDRICIAAVPAAKPAALTEWDEGWLLAVDEHLVVVAKPAGLLAEAPPYRSAPNLHALAVQRFGPLTLLHRLDRDTSGVMLLTRTPLATQLLSAALQAHTLAKEYVAIVSAPNQLADEGRISARLAPHPQQRTRMMIVAKGGQGAVTRYAVIARLPDRQFVRLWPLTGRTHQLRVHLAAQQAPILGDRLYGDAAAAPRLLLHAYSLVVPPLGAATERMFVAPVPAEFAFAGVNLVDL